jgi:chemotaxis protein histidine kinase CheA/CheY-like chemotaxis protein
MVPVTPYSVQTYQTFHQITLNHLQVLEEAFHELRFQRGLDRLLGFLGRLHEIKVSARHLGLAGFEQIAHHLKGVIIAFSDPQVICDSDCLRSLLQLPEIFRMGLLAHASTWPDDVTAILDKLPVVLEDLTRCLPILSAYLTPSLSAESIRSDVQRLLIVTALSPELARLEMMLINTPNAQLQDGLRQQLLRLNQMAVQLEYPSLMALGQDCLEHIQAPTLTSEDCQPWGHHILEQWCKHCQLLLQPPIPEVAETSAAYAQAHDHAADVQAMFFQQAQDLLKTFEQHLEGPAQDPLPLQAIFRIAHSLKGTAAGMGYEVAKTVAHDFETLLEGLIQRSQFSREVLQSDLITLYLGLRDLWLDPQNHPLQDCPSSIQTAFQSLRGKLGLSSFAPSPQASFQALSPSEGQNAEIAEAPPLRLVVDPNQSLFATEVEERLTALSARCQGPEHLLAGALRDQATLFMGLGESLDLPLVADIGRTAIAALDANPDRVDTIIQLAVQGWLGEQLIVLSGYPYPRTGISSSLAALTEVTVPEEDAFSLEDIFFEPVPIPAGRGGGSERDLISAPRPLEPIAVDLEVNSAPLATDRGGAAEESAIPVGLITIPTTSQEIRIPLPLLGPVHESLQQLYCQHHTHPSLGPTLQRLWEQWQQVCSVPLGDVLERLRPVVEAVAQQTGKAVTLTLSGTELRVNRWIAEQLYDPLLHLVRNAIDHGIEHSRTRQAFQKPVPAILHLEAIAQGNTLVFSVMDDGQGIDFNALRNRVMEQEGLTSNQAEGLDQAALTNWLFAPGISTADTVGELSGRGIGLDVVKAVMDRLQAQVEVESQMGAGTTFRFTIPEAIAVPLSPAVGIEGSMADAERADDGETPLKEGSVLSGVDLPAMTAPGPVSSISLEQLLVQPAAGPALILSTAGMFLWSVDAFVFMLDCQQIQEFVMPQITASHRQLSLLSWREQTIPILDLMDELEMGLSAHRAIAEDAEEIILVVKRGNRSIALRTPLQHLVSDTQLVINPLPSKLRNLADASLTDITAPRYIYGLSPRKEQSPVVVVNVQDLLQRSDTNIEFVVEPPAVAAFPVGKSEELPAVEFMAEPPSDQPPVLAQVLVVDDSRMAREIVSLTLKQGGYGVCHAKDGQDALEQLQGGLTVDVVICDVAMPRMNGLDFLKRCRKDEHLQSLPIAMLSNCDSKTHSDLALKAGANAYLTKPYEEDEFLKTVAELLVGVRG